MTNKIYMNDSYLTELQANVLFNRETNGKHHLVLDKTIFYPEGVGGQLGDIGEINGVKIEKSIIKDGKIFHISNEKIDGSRATIKIDWENRFKSMQQHTSQHLVSACFVRLYGINTLSFHASEDFISIDLDVESISDEEIKNVEDLANTIVQNNFPIKTYFPKEEEIKDINFRRVPKVDKDLRVVEIDAFDFAACGGTHVKYTGELGLVKIINNFRQNGKTRIQVVSGKSALKDYSIKNHAVSEISKKLSANEHNLLEKFNLYEEHFEETTSNNMYLKNALLELLKENFLERKIKNPEFDLIVEEFDILPFKEANTLGKKFETEENLLLILFSRYGEKVQFIGKSLKSIDLSDLSSSLKSNYDFKGGGNKEAIQGIFYVKEDVDIKNLIVDELKKIRATF